MATKSERFQQAYHRYQRENSHAPSGTDAAVRWAVQNGLIELPDIDPFDALASQMASALREETSVGPDGREFRVNHAARIMRGGVQRTLWAEMGHAPHSHMERAFTQRREQIIGDCLHLKADVDAYNRLTDGQQLPVQLILDFTDDVAEREIQMKAA